MNDDWKKEGRLVEDALRLAHPDRLLCNCRQVYSPDGIRCPAGCSANQFDAKQDLARALLAAHSRVAD